MELFLFLRRREKRMTRRLKKKNNWKFCSDEYSDDGKMKPLMVVEVDVEEVSKMIGNFVPALVNVEMDSVQINFPMMES
jgi:hypothetical protein